jgi:NAD(P)-dependent dehydrogenase (short-subunit alcohol dehydrogenase family)
MARQPIAGRPHRGPTTNRGREPMQISLAGRNALITGGSLGIGRACGERFARSGGGVALLARRAEPLAAAVAEIRAAAPGVQVAGYACDVSRADEIAAAWQRVTADFGSVDILVNNAGQSNARPFETVTDEAWQQDIDLKLMAAVRLTRLAFPGMRSRGFGRVINMLNTAAKAPPPASVPTSVTRAAGMALTKVLAGEGAPHGICVNALLIGRIRSDQIRRAHARSGAGTPLEAYIEAAGRNLPMRRMGTAEEAANVACFLASDAASYLTGCAINLDGGLSPVP